MRVFITEDERWPVYSISRGEGDAGEIDVPVDMVRRWEVVARSYEQVQREMNAARLTEPALPRTRPLRPPATRLPKGICRLANCGCEGKVHGTVAEDI